MAFAPRAICWRDAFRPEIAAFSFFRGHSHRGKGPPFNPMSSVADTHVNSQARENSGGVELSVVMPCLDEAATVGICVKKAIDALERHGIRGEVIVADNGST